MAISSISAVTSALPTLPTQAAAAPEKAGTGFKDLVGHAIDSLSQTQNKADNLALQAATGQLTDVHDYTLAASEASLATELTVAVRNKAVDAFNEIMRMSI